jgi:nitrite reductase/ring-hydroxylating ferredoxin subunit
VPIKGGPVCEGTLFGNSEFEISPETGEIHQHLSERDFNLACPWHGVEYDIKTGVCVANKKLKLQSYKIVAKGSELFIQI